MAKIRLSAREAAYRRTLVKILPETRTLKDAIDDEAGQVIKGALRRIGRQLAKMQYREGPPTGELFPLLSQPSAMLDAGLDLELGLRQALQQFQ